MVDLEILPSGLKEVLKDENTGLEVRIYYLECLAQATYLILHENTAFIVDPRRDVDVFIKELTNNRLTLRGILETHFHADFVSGHNEMMQKTNATIYFGPTAGSRCKFPHYELMDGEVIEFTGRYDIKVMHTPGHTPESVVYLVTDKSQNGNPIMAFTGDTLFIGSCGRPDLVGSVGFTSEQMGQLMFNTLKNKICTLPSTVKVFPAHGAGSPCGKNLSSDLYSTIGKEKETNPALQYTDEKEFIKFLTSDQPAAPSYFSYNVQQNTTGAMALRDELSQIPFIDAKQFKSLLEGGGTSIIDTRQVEEFNSKHIKGALNFPLGEAGGAIVRVEDGNFAIWVGTLVSNETKLLIVTKQGKESETLQRLARIAYTNIAGVLEGGMDGWNYPTETVERLNLKSSPTVLTEALSKGHQLIDIRTLGEYRNNSTHDTINVPLNEIYQRIPTLDKSTQYIVYCSTGYRSVIGSSIMRERGLNTIDIYGGFASISVYSPELTTSGKICPTMKSMIEKLEQQQ